MSRKRLMVLSLMGVLLFWSSMASAEALMAGMKASDWSFKDSEGKAFSMASWDGKVLLVIYVDPDESDLNEHFTRCHEKGQRPGTPEG